MVTEAWVQSDRHRGTVHPEQASSVSAREPETSECGGKGSFIDNNASGVISSNSPGEQLRSSAQNGKSYRCSVSVTPLENTDNDRTVQENDSRNESHCLVATERGVRFTKSGQASNEKEDVKSEVNIIKLNEIATGTKQETTSRPDTKNTTPNDHLTEVRPHCADVNEEPLLLEVLRATPNSGSLKRREGRYKQYKGNDARRVIWGDLSSITDVHGNPWDTTAETEFTKSATCKTPPRFQFSQNMDLIKDRSKIQNYKSQTTPGYSERYGIDSKGYPAVKKEAGNSGVRQQAAEPRPWSFRNKSVNRNHRMTAPAFGTSKRGASMVSRRASDENILQGHNKMAYNKLEEDDPCLPLDAQSCRPVIKGRQPWRSPEVPALDESLQTTEDATVTVDDVNNNREHKLHCGGRPWVIDEPVPTGDQKMQRLVSARQHQVDTTKVRRPAPPKTAPLRKPDKAQQQDTKNVSTEGDGEPHAAPTSLIEDPILVKVSKRNRNVGKFTCKPDPMPNAVCFEIAGTDLRHHDVKSQIEGLIQKFPEVKIIGIQFHNRALVNNQREMNNRWIITTNSSVGCKLLVGNNLTFEGQEVQLRLYDEVISTEYQQFVRMTNFVKMMDTRKILS